MNHRVAETDIGRSVLEKAKRIHALQSKRKKTLTEAGKKRKKVNAYWKHENDLARGKW